MWSAVGILVAGTIIFWGEGSWLLKQKRKKEMAVFSISLLIAVALYSGIALRLPIPSPTVVIGNVLEPVVKPIAQWLKGSHS